MTVRARSGGGRPGRQRRCGRSCVTPDGLAQRCCPDDELRTTSPTPAARGNATPSGLAQRGRSVPGFSITRPLPWQSSSFGTSSGIAWRCHAAPRLNATLELRRLLAPSHRWSCPMFGPFNSTLPGFRQRRTSGVTRRCRSAPRTNLAYKLSRFFGALHSRLSLEVVTVPATVLAMSLSAQSRWSDRHDRFVSSAGT